MVDSARSPRPLWARLARLVLLAVTLVAVVWFIMTKELHGSVHFPHTLVHAAPAGLSAPLAVR